MVQKRVTRRKTAEQEKVALARKKNTGTSCTVGTGMPSHRCRIIKLATCLQHSKHYGVGYHFLEKM